MKIMLTGSRGKLGSLSARLLTGHGHEVVSYDRQDGQDILDTGTLGAAMQGCEMVLHLAGIPHPLRTEGIQPFFETNVCGTTNVLTVAQYTGVRRVVYASSTAYYGCNVAGKLYPLYFPIDEAHPPAHCDGRATGALDAYNQSKVMVEQLLAWYGTNHVFETVALRIAPANPQEGQYPDGFDWRTCDDYRRGCFFSNCHPDYATQALVLALEAEGPFWYEAFNVADRYTPVDVYEFLEREYPDVEITRTLNRYECLFNLKKAIDELGFEPKA